MGFFLPNNKKIKGIFIQNAPNTYDADITAPDMQRGKTAWVKGKKVVGTGKAFAFAEYGSYLVRKISDSEGNERYGVSFGVGENTNVVFIAPTSDGDIVLQENFLVNIKNGEITTLGINHTTGGEINACYDKDRLIVYLTAFSKKRTVLRFFVGKDNAI